MRKCTKGLWIRRVIVVLILVLPLLFSPQMEELWECRICCYVSDRHVSGDAKGTQMVTTDPHVFTNAKKGWQ